MTTDLGPLYKIEFDVEEPTDSHTFGGLAHVILDIRPACHQPEETSRYTDAELLDAWRWHAGVIARVGVYLADQIDDARKSHGCGPGWRGEGSHGCLHVSGDDILQPDEAVARHEAPYLKSGVSQAYPSIWVTVAGERKRLGWFVRFIQEAVDKALASDQQPAPLPQPQPEQHAGQMLTDTTSTADEEQPR